MPEQPTPSRWAARACRVFLALFAALAFLIGLEVPATADTADTAEPGWDWTPEQVAQWCIDDETRLNTYCTVVTDLFSITRVNVQLRPGAPWPGGGPRPAPPEEIAEQDFWPRCLVLGHTVQECDDLANQLFDPLTLPLDCGGYINLNPFNMSFDIGGWISCESINALYRVAELFEAAVNNPLTQIDDTEWAIVLSQTARWAGLMIFPALALCVLEIAKGALTRNGSMMISGAMWALAAWPATMAALIIFARLIRIGDWASAQILHSVVHMFNDPSGAALVASGMTAGGLMAVKMATAALTLKGPVGWLVLVGVVAGAFIMLLALVGVLALVTYGQMLLAALAPVALFLAGNRHTRSMSVRWLEMATTLVLVKPIISGILSLNLLLITQGDGFNTLITGIIGMMMAVAAPLAVFQFVGFVFANLGPAIGGAVNSAKGAFSGLGSFAGKVQEANNKGKADDDSYKKSANKASAGGKADATDTSPVSGQPGAGNSSLGLGGPGQNRNTSGQGSTSDSASGHTGDLSSLAPGPISGPTSADQSDTTAGSPSDGSTSGSFSPSGSDLGGSITEPVGGFGGADYPGSETGGAPWSGLDGSDRADTAGVFDPRGGGSGSLPGDGTTGVLGGGGITGGGVTDGGVLGGGGIAGAASSGPQTPKRAHVGPTPPAPSTTGETDGGRSRPGGGGGQGPAGGYALNPTGRGTTTGPVKRFGQIRPTPTSPISTSTTSQPGGGRKQYRGRNSTPGTREQQ